MTNAGGTREALEEGGVPALVRFLRRELGDETAELVLRHLGLEDETSWSSISRNRLLL